MSSLVTASKSYFDHAAMDMRKICKPLKQYGITYACYGKIFDNNTSSALVTHGESLYHHWKKGYPICSPLPKVSTVKKVHYLPFLRTKFTVTEKQQFDDYRSLFDLAYPIFFLERYASYTEFCCFATAPNNIEIINFYLSHVTLLVKFKYHFKQLARDLIRDVDKHRILLPGATCSPLETNLINDESAWQEILNNSRLRRHYLSTFGTNTWITKREMDVVKCIAKGCTIKETAVYLGLSPRTVENYFYNVKLKVGSRKRSEIIKIISEANLL
jgi:DNA-binding CsgD family transcriptional regulator